MHYRRAFVPGAIYFFTIVTAHRRPVFHDEAALELLRQAFRHVNEKRPSTVNAMVVLPDHLHCLWTLSPADSDYPRRWRLIKTWVTKRSDFAHHRHPERTVCQARYWEHFIKDETDYRRYVEYIHYNPVKHGCVRKPMEWPHSSFLRYVKEGLYAERWGSAKPVWDVEIGHE